MLDAMSDRTFVPWCLVYSDNYLEYNISRAEVRKRVSLSVDGWLH